MDNFYPLIHSRGSSPASFFSEDSVGRNGSAYLPSIRFRDFVPNFRAWEAIWNLNAVSYANAQGVITRLRVLAITGLALIILGLTINSGAFALLGGFMAGFGLSRSAHVQARVNTGSLQNELLGWNSPTWCGLITLIGTYGKSDVLSIAGCLTAAYGFGIQARREQNEAALAPSTLHSSDLRCGIAVLNALICTGLALNIFGTVIKSPDLELAGKLVSVPTTILNMILLIYKTELDNQKK